MMSNIRTVLPASRFLPSHVLWLCVLAAWVVVPAIITDWEDSPERWIPLLCYATAIQFIMQLQSWAKVSGTLFDPYVVFLTAATTFNAGRALDRKSVV